MEETTPNPNWTEQAPSNPAPVATPLIQKRFWGPTTFGLIILMFFFTFIDIKCNGVSLGTIKGYELATGYHVNKGGGGLESLSSGSDSHKEKPNLFALGALVIAVGGFGLGFIKSTPGSIAKIICGFLGFIMMTLLFLNLKDASRKMNNEMSSGAEMLSSAIKITVEFQLAFWIALLLFIAGGVLGLVQLVMKLKKPA